MTINYSDYSRPIRVAMLARAVFPLHGYGGIERHVYHLTKYLTRLGVEVTLYVQTPPANAEQRDLRPRAIETLRYDYTSPFLPPNGVIGRQINFPIYSWRIGRQAVQRALNGDFDIVHTQGLCAFGYALARQRDARLRVIPFIANPHGMEEFRTPDRRKWLAYAPFRQLYAYGHRQADRVIATDACTKDDLPRYLGVDPARVVVIPSAIDVDECLSQVRSDLRTALRFRLGLTRGGPILLSVGRLEPNKGFDILIAALARLRDELPANWRWLLVGSGSARAALEQQARDAGLGEHALFVGRLSDEELHSLYEEIDLFVHPTRYEGSSLVTLEAMIHRRPVVASAIGGIPDKVFPGRNGLLAQPGDVDDLTAQLRAAFAARDQWSGWGAEGERIARATFDWPVVAQQTLDLYRELLAATTLPSS
ncbi:glycosyltransferase family 4 protein [Chloroflexus sp.]|uniref:glycosyltransferase family 4 protein n=1 Tax=Chloroflexus sp. TaxID=1904827 RepID=UPI002631751F|nr:glycosyltransferase family 4 protein [uncultured Chloroflexus sp.]